MSRWHLLGLSLVAAACSSSSDPSQGVPDSRPAVCGDGVCSATEVNDCPADCGAGPNSGCVGGTPDGSCESGETAATCRDDCEGSHPQPDGGTPQPDASTNPIDGGGGTLNCQDETVILECAECVYLQMCTGVNATDCMVCLGGGLSLCDGGAADGICEADEDSTICPEDCTSMCDGGAPDGVCEADEDDVICPEDCP